MDEPATTLEIRRVSASDSTLFASVADDVFNDAISPSQIGMYLSAPETMLVVALDKGQVIGQVTAVVHRHPDRGDDLYIDDVGVAPAHWRRGIASRMIDEICLWAKERGCREAWLATDPDNKAAQGLYAQRAAAQPCLIYGWDL